MTSYLIAESIEQSNAKRCLIAENIWRYPATSWKCIAENIDCLLPIRYSIAENLGSLVRKLWQIR